MEIRKKASGSYTIEAAFIVPIVLGLLFIILYMLFLLRDRVILQANAENLIFLLAEEEVPEKKNYEEYISYGLWILEPENITIRNKKMTVKAAVKGTTEWKFPVLNIFMSGKQEITVSEKYYKIQPEEVIRYGSELLK